MEIMTHKDLNVIKISLLFFFCFALESFSQEKIQGKYSVPIIFAYEYYLFEKDGTFEYHSGADLGDDIYGKGHYQIKNDSLILNYDLTKLKTNSYVKYKTYSNDSDSTILIVKVFNQKGIGLPNVSVFNLKDRYGEATDNDGQAVLKFKKQAGSKKIEASHLCCSRHSFDIDTKLNYEIEVYLAEGLNKPLAIKDQVEKYEIIKNSKHKLELKKGDQIITLNKQL